MSAHNEDKIYLRINKIHLNAFVLSPCTLIIYSFFI